MIKMGKVIIKNLFILCGLGFLLSYSVGMFITFLWAYFFNDYSFSININMFGEAPFELMFLLATLFWGAWAFYEVFNILTKQS